jgi:hypothetical protein
LHGQLRIHCVIEKIKGLFVLEVGHFVRRCMDKKALEAAAGTYLRAAAAAVAALYMSGITDPKTLANAFLAGLLGPLAKALNPKDASYGFGAKK